MQYMNRSANLTEEEITQRQLERENRESERQLSNNRLGMWIFQTSWIMLFVALIFIYWIIGFQPGWRPTPEQAPGPYLPTLATIGLIVSGWLAGRALKVVEATEPDEAGQRFAFVRDWFLSLVLGLIFLVIMMIQFFAVTIEPDGPQFGTIYRVMIGYHAIHAVVIGVMMIRVWYLGRDGRYHRDNIWPIEGMAKLWYFVVVAWLLFYAVLYLPYLA